MPITEDEKLKAEYMEGVSCHHCIDNVSDEQRERFAERQKQIELAQARGEGHIGNEAHPTAHSVYAGLVERGDAVTLVCPTGSEHEYPVDADIVYGDSSSADILIEAGAKKANYILALRNDDAENAFSILAAKEVAGEDTKTIALVNSSKHIPQIKRVKPDVVFSLQLLGSELLVRTLKGETIDNKLITKLFFGDAE